MRIYKAQTYDKDLGALLTWHGSKREAQQEVRRVQRERREYAKSTGDPTDAHAQGPEGVDAYDIPPTRAGFLSFLNAHFTSNNG